MAAGGWLVGRVWGGGGGEEGIGRDREGTGGEARKERREGKGRVKLPIMPTASE